MSNATPKSKVTRMVTNIALGLGGGAALGFALYRFVGCRSGACPITANPWTSMIYGMVIGLMIALSR